MIIIGVLLEILAAALGTLSKQLIAISTHLEKPWLFHIGATINILVGPVVDASAYAFAPQVIVAPFACLDVIFNALTAPHTLKWQNEVLTRVHLFGCGFVALGASLTAIFADAENQVFSVTELERQLLRPASLIYFCVELTGIFIATFFLRKNLMSPQVRGISLGVIAGVLMGNVFFVKGIVSLVRHSIDTGEHEAWLRITPYICIACAALGAVLGHMFMRKGLAEYKGVFLVTIFEGAHISAACLSGCVVMGEMSGSAWWRYICYWASVLLIVAGMCLINSTAAESKMGGGSTHVAQHFVGNEEEKNGFMDGRDPAPIGKTLDNFAEDQFELEAGGPLEGDGSPIGGDIALATFGSRAGENDSPAPSPEHKRSVEHLDSDETGSNVSTSTPEGDLNEVQNGNGENGHREMPVFSGAS